MLYFLDPGIAEKELDADPRTFLRRLFYSNSGDLAKGLQPNMMVADTGRLTDSLYEPDKPLPWLTEADLDVYAQAYERSGFRGALNTYRSLHRSWELLAGWGDLAVEIPALYIGGTRDLVQTFPGMKEAIQAMKVFAPKAEQPIMLDGVGHWIQHEAPEGTNGALAAFFKRAL
jgi:pimeloyl-ACP methyl ester carboxylesterase